MRVRKSHTDNTLPLNGEVFVFGSNEAGRHGLGAAKIAAGRFGAIYGVGDGYMTNSETISLFDQHCYAIATKNKYIKTLPIDVVKRNIEKFVGFSKGSQLQFFLTRVGCGLAGYADDQIAPFFKECGDNVNFPKEWLPYV